ncbi:MAG: hypothetical protein QXF25_01545 [Candidatus Pacearchaeota archaeon]
MKTIKITINLTNKWLYTLIFLGIFLIIGAIVFALNENLPWHPLSQIQVDSNLDMVNKNITNVNKIKSSITESNNINVTNNITINGLILKSNNSWEEANFSLGKNAQECGETPYIGNCYPNQATADKVCRNKGYLYASYYTDASSDTGYCREWRGNYWRRWNCGSDGKSQWIETLYCVR